MVIPFPCCLGIYQGIHEAQIGKGIPAVHHLASIGSPTISMYKARRECCTAEDYRNGDIGLIKSLQIVLHEGSGLN